MVVPTIYEISTKDVVSIDIDSFIYEAIKEMALHDIRDVIIKDEMKNLFFILTANDLIKFKLNHIEFNLSLRNLSLHPIKKFLKQESILNVLDKIENDSYVAVVDESEKLCGIVSYTDIISNIDPQDLVHREQIKTLLINSYVKRAFKDESTLEVIKRIGENVDDCIIVMDEDIAIGVLTTKDVINILYSNRDLNKPISEYMSTPLDTLQDNTTIKEALIYIKSRHYKRIIVVDEDNSVIGIITQKNLMRMVYNKTIDLMRQHGYELVKMNKLLQEKAEKFEEEATFDSLTNVYNRSKFEDILINEIDRVKKFKFDSFGLLILDIDFFKKINDTYGHLVGDLVLKEFSRVIKNNIRKTDIIARWGGEEFILLFPQTNLRNSALTAEKLRVTIEGHLFEKVGHINCSIGVGYFREDDNYITLFERVDKALYRAKESGRNRVEVEVES